MEKYKLIKKNNNLSPTSILMSGFSLLELLIYVAILSVLVVIVSNTFISLSKVNGQSSAKSEVNTSIRFASEILRQDIKNASIVSIPNVGTPSSTLVLTRNDIQITYDVVDGVLRRKEGESVASNLTNPNIIVGTPVFERIENTNQIFDDTNVAVKMDINFSYNSTSTDWIYSTSLQTVVNLYKNQ